MLVDALKKEDERKRQLWVNEGIEQGIEIGEAKGKALGKAERDRQLARAMTANDYPAATIAQLLAISEEEMLRFLTAEDEPGL
jgi:hypothetical protein